MAVYTGVQLFEVYKQRFQNVIYAPDSIHNKTWDQLNDVRKKYFQESAFRAEQFQSLDEGIVKWIQ